MENPFVYLFLMSHLCDKYYKPVTVQNYIADCVSWVPRLTLLVYEQIGLTYVFSEQNLLVCRGFAVFC